MPEKSVLHSWSMSAVIYLSSELGNTLFHPRGPAPSTLGSKLQKQRSMEVTRGRFGGQAWKWWTSLYSHSRSQKAVRWPYLTAAELGRSLAVHLGEEKMGLVNSEAISTTLNLDINCKRSLIGFPVFTFVLSQFFFSTCQPNDPSKRHSDHFPPLLNTFQWLFISCVYSKALIYFSPTFLIPFLAFSTHAHSSTATLAAIVSFKYAKHIAFPLSPAQNTLSRGYSQSSLSSCLQIYVQTPAY